MSIETLGGSPEAEGHDWHEFVDVYSRELQLQRNGEDEGWTTTSDTFVAEAVFRHPEEAAALFIALASSADPQVRMKAIEGLDKLITVAPHETGMIQDLLMQDEDPQVRQAALHFSTYFG